MAIYMLRDEHYGVYHNPTLGLISFHTPLYPDYWITIADKNLGATSCYSGTKTAATCGNLFQWGNNYAFPFSGSVTTSSTRVDTTGYGPGNYYSDSTFITGGTAWDSPVNNNLWGGTTATFAAMQGPCPSGFHIPSGTTSGTSTDLNYKEYRAFADLTDSSATGVSKQMMIESYLLMPGVRRSYTNGAATTSTTCYMWFALSGGTNTGRYLTSSCYGQCLEYKTWGFPIRPFKNEAVIPDSSRTLLFAA